MGHRCILKLLHRRCLYPILCLLLLLLYHKPAYADTGWFIPVILGGAWPAYSTYLTMGITFILILGIETIVIRTMSGLSWGRSIFASFFINAFSSIFGGIFFFLVGTTLNDLIGIVLVIALFIVFLFIWRRNPDYRWLYWLAVVTFIIGIIGLYYYFESPRYGVWALWLAIPLTLMLGFGTTILFEVVAAGKYISPSRLPATVLRMNIYSYIALILIGFLYWPNPVQEAYSFEYFGAGDLISKGEFSEATKLSRWWVLDTPQLLGIKAVSSEDEESIGRRILCAAEETFRFRVVRNQSENNLTSQEMAGNLTAYIEQVLENETFTDEDRRNLTILGKMVSAWSEMGELVEKDDAEGVRDLFIRLLNDEDMRGYQSVYSELGFLYPPGIVIEYIELKPIGEAVREEVDLLREEFGEPETE